MAQEWFESWFDSPYYHVLYKNRNDSEAAFFIDNLIAHLNLPAGATVWDNACGKGRHSIYLNKKGYRVIGTDLSENSIRLARESENETLDFYVHDMRQPFMVNYFDAVFNLFTSFGYFANPGDNNRVFQSVARGLRKGGLFVIDYFNSKLVIDLLKEKETKTVEGIEFHIEKKIEHNSVLKCIRFEDKGKAYAYQEQVKLFDRDCFSELASNNGLQLINCFGDYQLHAFDERSSQRLILIFQKQ